MNDHFKIKKDNRYWNIILGGWLHCFIFSYYEKHLLIKNTFKNNYQFIVPSIKYKQNLIQKIIRVFLINIYILIIGKTICFHLFCRKKI